MNELEILREQLAREAAHASETARILARSGDPTSPREPQLREACADYLQFALTRLDPNLRATGAALLAAARSGGASDNSAGWRHFLEFFESAWTARQRKIDAAVGNDRSIACWRATAAIDADSILEERARYARVKGFLHE